MLQDGQSLGRYGIEATVVHIPGHTPGSIGILFSDGNFFSGDTFDNRGMPSAAVIVENEAQLEDSMKKLRAMRITYVFPGHGEPFSFTQYKWKT